VLVKEAATRVAMLKTGQVDVARISLDEVQGVSKAGLKIAEDPQPTSVRIHLYATYYDKAGPVKDVRVRQALNLAVNRQEIVDTLLHGKGKPAAVFPSSPISIGYPADLKPYPYDPAKAKKLLAEAGYPNGFPIKLFALPTGGFTQYLQLAEIVAGYWEAIGVKASIVPTDIGAFRPLYIANPQSPKIVGQAGTSPPPDGSTAPTACASGGPQRAGSSRWPTPWTTSPPKRRVKPPSTALRPRSERPTRYSTASTAASPSPTSRASCGATGTR